ncbi:MAG: bacillithiol biosynthesis BshC, partial [Bacteroidota bacterium]
MKSISDFLKSNNFTSINREILVTELKRQYHIFDATEKVKQNINALTHKNVYTVTTGHQLCLFTGPAYFFYKIISVIQIAKKLNEKFPEYKFVPVYWMASEDHDKEEINHTYCFGKKIIWETNQDGKVGSFNLQGIQDALNEFLKILGNTDVSHYIGDLLNRALKGSKNLADFTRFFLNEIFGVYGLLVMDGDSIE